MRKLALLTILGAFASLSTVAQTNPAGQALYPQTFGTANLTASATSCLVNNNTAVLRLHLPNNAAGATFTTSGTYVGTATFQASADNQTTWPTAEGSQTAPGTTSITLNGFTDLCMFVSAYTSGTVVATINVSLNTGPAGPAGPAGGSSGALGVGAAVGPVINVKVPSTLCPGCTAVGDAKITGSCSTSAGSGAIVDTSHAPWVTADVGKRFVTTSNISGASNLTAANFGSITAFTDSAHVTVIPVAINTLSNQYCAWATQDDTAAIAAAVTAASVNAALNGATTGPVNTNISATPFTVYTPRGGYLINGNVYTFANSSNIGICPNFLGSGPEETNFYFQPSMNQTFIKINGCSGAHVGNFAYTSMNATETNTCSGFSCGLISMEQGRNYIVDNINGGYTLWVTAAGCGEICMYGDSFSSVRDVFLQGGSGFSANPKFAINTGGTGVTVENSFFSNGNSNILVNATSARGTQGREPTFIQVSSDECGTPPCIVLTNAQMSWEGGLVFGEGPAISVDTTSSLWMSQTNVGSFNNAGNFDAITIAGNGFVDVTQSTLRGNGTGHIINAPSTATFIDAGGNQWQNCVTTTCTVVGAAQYTSQGFTGGVVPKASVTHTPNTCYAVTGNLLATAQNLCTILLDQNYQILSMTAQSGGTTPANSACATPPIITMSDGTRTFTLTMTTGKTQWSSAVDAITNANQAFASGTTMTISIAANTCATPPANVSVNYVLQSVLNP